MYFGDKPLVIGPYIDVVVNPVHVDDHKENLKDVSASFRRLIGGQLESLRYLSSSMALLKFSNGYQLLLASRQSDPDDRRRIGTYEILFAEEDENIEELDIELLCADSGKEYANTVTDYQEDSIAIFDKERAYILYLIPGKTEKYQLKIVPCSIEMTEEYRHQFPMGKPNNIKCFYEDGELTNIIFDYGDEYLYIKTFNFPEFDVLLSEQKFDSSNICSLLSKKGKHIEFTKRKF
jgi:hypothetical protein